MINDQYDLAAKREGWAIFDCDGSENGPFQICKLDDPEACEGGPGFLPRTLASDEEAWLIVRTGTGEHHSHARNFIAEHNPQEWEAINTWYAQWEKENFK